MNPITNAGVIKPMNTADWKKHALQFNTPGEIMAQDMIEFASMADLVDANPDNFRIFGPDETKSNCVFASLHSPVSSMVRRTTRLR